MRKWRFRSGADAKSRTPVTGVIFLQQLSLGVRAGSSRAAMGYRTVRTVLRNWLRYGSRERRLLRSVLRQHNTHRLSCGGSRTAPEFGLRRRGRSPLLMALGELHGRNLASALMRSRVHNRTRDRGGKPIRLASPWALPPVLPEGPGALSRRAWRGQAKISRQ